LFAVVGKPILHSRSPGLFRAAFGALGMDAAYTRVIADSAPEVLQAARQLRLTGLNVTAPFKETILPLLDHLDEVATETGAVNTVVFKGEETHGYNTDPAGVRGMLSMAHIDPRGSRVAVIGAGGAARAVLYALAHWGADDVILVNRSPSRGQRVAAQFGCRLARGEAATAEIRRAGIVLCCLPVAAIPPHPQWLRPHHTVVDANYWAPGLADAARAAGCRYVSGKEWLVAQAAAGFTLMTSQPAPIDAMRLAFGPVEPTTTIPGHGSIVVRVVGPDVDTAQVADVTIHTSNRSPAEVTRRIQDEIRQTRPR